MQSPDPPTPASRHQAQVRLRRLTRTSVLAAFGATAVIGVVVADEHPGASGSTKTTTSSTTAPSPPTSTSTTASPGSSSTSATSAPSATTPSTTAPTTTTTTPRVISGGTS